MAAPEKHRYTIAPGVKKIAQIRGETAGPSVRRRSRAAIRRLVPAPKYRTFARRASPGELLSGV